MFDTPWRRKIGKLPKETSRAVVTSRTVSPLRLPVGGEETERFGLNNIAAAKSRFFRKANLAAKSAPAPTPMTIMGSRAIPSVKIDALTDAERLARTASSARR